MTAERSLKNMTFRDLLQRWPFLDKYLGTRCIDFRSHRDITIGEYFRRHTPPGGGDGASDIDGLLQDMTQYIDRMSEFLGVRKPAVESLTILPGYDKTGRPEGFGSLVIRKGDIISIVGPTGAGKSRLLADIEWVAQNDTPTGRTILINGAPPEMKWRFSPAGKLVAQLSQNMNFVIDMTVTEFLSLHAESRLVEHPEAAVERIIREANTLSGERFDPDTPVTRLSGGQSRALMIADTAVLSRSPVVLIDEIENAGIDRKRALGLLLSEDKIVLMATHDPALALLARRRIIIRNGGIRKIIETSEDERRLLEVLESMSRFESACRDRIRDGENLHMTHETMIMKRTVDIITGDGTETAARPRNQTERSL